MRRLLWSDSTAEEVSALVEGCSDGYAILVAQDPAGGLCGFAEVGLRGYAEGCDSSPVGYLEGIWVDPDLRRSDVGRALVRRAEEWAREKGCAEFASDALVENESSLAFHRALGFEEVERIVCFRRRL
jgi:aminoglycoside 6'-N-acetyltransferase I